MCDKTFQKISDPSLHRFTQYLRCCCAMRLVFKILRLAVDKLVQVSRTFVTIIYKNVYNFYFTIVV